MDYVCAAIAAFVGFRLLFGAREGRADDAGRVGRLARAHARQVTAVFGSAGPAVPPDLEPSPAVELEPDSSHRIFIGGDEPSDE